MAAFSPSHVFINCSFHGRDCNECGFSSLSGRSDYVALVDCNDDMTNHLAMCQYLVHKGKSQAIKQGRNMRVINLEMAIQTMDMYGVTVSIGSREF